MSLPELPRNASRRDMRKALVRLRLEMQRQELRHESLLLTQPLRQAREFTRQLDIPHAPLWGMAAVAVLGFFAARKGSLRRGLRLGSALYPLLLALLKNPPRSGPG
ncbi:hypothetical protein SA496_07995 [Pseudomonas sp. JS3066]|jgi:hypothetical protein|uniref:hypothetical protein n=1 Tax=unclassified Pseudomonas TaxID=196821 RepID=UPI000EAA1190|nr:MULTISPECIES: hypothetical protein [unclassified Pseudomonas]AYF87377.1 hypothetical protein D6Z43_09490 [Pseudomonas sp. DY-1]MDH4652961.1 hypothetical protein [Pseudomonas sp. BN606]MRK23124.1 hypothetical protein [Pseudomonas sp. JG-B]WVK95095.1 hypothetical protein SA496_07995 [Pseudomonas sp. JS3066]